MRLSEQRYIGFTRSWYRRGSHKHHIFTVVFDNSTKTLSFRCEYKGKELYDSFKEGKTYPSQTKCLTACLDFIERRVEQMEKEVKE